MNNIVIEYTDRTVVTLEPKDWYVREDVLYIVFDDGTIGSPLRHIKAWKATKETAN